MKKEKQFSVEKPRERIKSYCNPQHLGRLEGVKKYLWPVALGRDTSICLVWAWVTALVLPHFTELLCNLEGETFSPTSLDRCWRKPAPCVPP